MSIVSFGYGARSSVVTTFGYGEKAAVVVAPEVVSPGTGGSGAGSYKDTTKSARDAYFKKTRFTKPSVPPGGMIDSVKGRGITDFTRDTRRNRGL